MSQQKHNSNKCSHPPAHLLSPCPGLLSILSRCCGLENAQWQIFSRDFLLGRISKIRCLVLHICKETKTSPAFPGDILRKVMAAYMFLRNILMAGTSRELAQKMFTVGVDAIIIIISPNR